MPEADMHSVSPIIIRRVDESDYKAVLDINSNVYGGADYMAALYFTFFHDHHHVMYVLEQDKQLVSLVNYELSLDESHVTTKCSRVRPSHQGRGLSPDKYQEFKVKLLQEFPGVIHEIQLFVVHEAIDGIQKKINQSDVLYRWAFINYRFTPQVLRLTLSQSDSDAVPLQQLSYSQSLHLLSTSGIFETFFKKFTNKYIPVGVSWTPMDVHDKTAIRDILFANNNLFVSFKDCCRNEDVTVPSSQQEILALSYVQMILSGTVDMPECLVHIFFYGKSTNVADLLTDHVTESQFNQVTYPLLEHVIATLSHICSVWKAEDRVRLSFHYPPTLGDVDDNEVKGCLAKCGLGEEFRRSRLEAVINIRPI